MKALFDVFLKRNAFEAQVMHLTELNVISEPRIKRLPLLLQDIIPTMKLFLLLLLFLVTVTADLIGYNRGVNNVFKHVRARSKLNNLNIDNQYLLAKYLLHLGRLQEAEQIMRDVKTTH